MMKRIRVGTPYHGKFCRNGSHFAHGGGSRTPLELLDKWNEPWLSYTVRDKWGIYRRIEGDGCTPHQHLLMFTNAVDKWAMPGYQPNDDLLHAVLAAKGVK